MHGKDQQQLKVTISTLEMESLHNLQDKIDYIFENNDAIYALAGSKFDESTNVN